MNSYLSLPLAIVKFWYYEAPVEIFGFFGSLNKAFFQLFALPLFIKTFFSPLKNEYRQGLVWFSRFVGMFIKTFIIIADLVIFIPLLLLELLTIVLFLAFPIMTVALLVL